MKIVVAYKWAPNPQDASVSGDGAVDWGRATSAVSEYDPVAVELGRRLADAQGAELIGISVGGKEVASPMAKKAALSRGFDRAVIVADDAFKGAGSTSVGLALAEIIRHIGDVDVVLTGDASVDVGAQLVPTVVAGALGWPVLTGVASIEGTAGDLTVERAYEGGSQVVKATGPIVLAAATDAVVPRVPGMKDILAAGKRPTEEFTVVPAEIAAAVVATGKADVKARKRQVIDGSDAAAAAGELVSALRADNVI